MFHRFILSVVFLPLVISCSFQKEIQAEQLLVHCCVGNLVIAVFFWLYMSLLTKFLNRDLRAAFTLEERRTQITIFKAPRVHIDESFHYPLSESSWLSQRADARFERYRQQWSTVLEIPADKDSAGSAAGSDAPSLQC